MNLLKKYNFGWEGENLKSGVLVWFFLFFCQALMIFFQKWLIKSSEKNY